MTLRRCAVARPVSLSRFRLGEMRVPENIRRTWLDQPEWIAALPGLTEECAEQWGLALEEPFESGVSLVVPAGERRPEVDGAGRPRSVPRGRRARALGRGRRRAPHRPGRRSPSPSAGALPARSTCVGRRQRLAGGRRDAAAEAPLRPGRDAPVQISGRRVAALVRGDSAQLRVGRKAFRAPPDRVRARCLPLGRPLGKVPREPGSPRRQHPRRRTRAMARHRSQAARRRAGAERRRPAPERRLARRCRAVPRPTRRPWPRSGATSRLGGRTRDRLGVRPPRRVVGCACERRPDDSRRVIPIRRVAAALAATPATT